MIDKGQKISNTIFLPSILPKKERNIWQNLAYRQEKKFFVRFLEELRTSKFAFEIFWPLAKHKVLSWWNIESRDKCLKFKCIDPLVSKLSCNYFSEGKFKLYLVFIIVFPILFYTPKFFEVSLSRKLLIQIERHSNSCRLWTVNLFFFNSIITFSSIVNLFSGNALGI